MIFRLNASYHQRVAASIAQDVFFELPQLIRRKRRNECFKFRVDSDFHID